MFFPYGYSLSLIISIRKLGKIVIFYIAIKYLGKTLGNIRFLIE
jgi:hypothetical protein